MTSRAKRTARYGEDVEQETDTAAAQVMARLAVSFAAREQAQLPHRDVIEVVENSNAYLDQSSVQSNPGDMVMSTKRVGLKVVAMSGVIRWFNRLSDNWQLVISGLVSTPVFYGCLNLLVPRIPDGPLGLLVVIPLIPVVLVTGLITSVFVLFVTAMVMLFVIEGTQKLVALIAKLLK